uniref:Pro-interleukin-16 n=1 Tax=Cacopsylla melanoneura TaxID=428564 RepID=A0A8D9DQK3_9HEMI
MSSTALTRLPPDGHEFPHSYQELTRDAHKCPPMSPSQLRDVQQVMLPDCVSYTTSNKTNISPTMVSSSGLPPLPNSGPPVMRKMSREGFSVKEFSREVSPRKELTPPRHNSGYINGTNCDNKTETNYYRYKTGDPSHYKYQNKDEKSEKSVRDKIAMFSNPSSNSSPSNSTNKSNSVSSRNGYSANSSPTSGHKFVDPLKRPLTREPSPFGVSPTSPTSPGKETVNFTSKEKLSSFKNDEIVSHNYLTGLDVDNLFTQKHYQETGVNCQSESSAYSSLSTSEILSDKNGDCGTYNGYPCKNAGFENSELCSPVHSFQQSGPNSQYASTEPICDTKEPKEIIGTRTNGITALQQSKRSDTAVAELYKDKYSTDLKTTSPLDAYRKFTSENKSDSETKGSHVILGRSNSSSRTTECKINDFSSLPRKLKVLKSQESRETSPETEGYSSKLSRTISFSNPPLLQSRSHSMVDIYRNNGADSISKLMEKRKKNISKLKGLIIPEKAEITVTSPAICNLPEIRVKPPTGFLGSTENLEPTGRSGILKQPIPLERTVSNPSDRKQPSVYERKRNNSVDNTIDQVDIADSIERERCKTASTWDLNDIPKYSPAFKRKSLTVYEKTKQFQQNPAEVKKVSPPKPPRKTYEKINNDQIDALISFDRIKENCKTKISKKVSDSETTEKSSSSDQNNPRKSVKDATKNVRSFDNNNASDRTCVKSVASEEKCKDILNPALDTGNERLKPNDRDRLTVKKLNILTAYDTETSESDNDSAISSNVSPPLSPLKRDEPDTPRSSCNQQRKISTNSSSSSTLTSGDDTIHYQPGETPAKRILKPQSVEAVNRKNVLSSAKFRSGDKTNEPVAKDADAVHEDLVRCVDSRLKVVGKNNEKNLRKVDDDEYSSSTLNENDEEDFEFNDECTDKRYTRRTIKVAYLDVVDSADSSDDILSSSDMISEGANSDDEMSVTSSECKPRVSDDWGNTPDEICSKIEEYIDDLEMYSQEIEEKRSRLINERTKRVRRTIESVKIDKFVRTNEFLRNARLNDANDKLNEMEDKQSVYLNKTKTVTKEAPPKTMSRSRVDRLRKDIEENETTETEASVEDYVPNPVIKPSCVNGKLREPSVKVDEIKAEYVRSISQSEVKSPPVASPVSRGKSTSVGDVRKYSRGLSECSKPSGVYNDHSKPTGLSSDLSRPSGTLYGRLPSSHHMRVSSLDSTTSDDSFTMQREQFGSITSIASSTSLISQQELQQLIDESGNQSLECGDSVANSSSGTSEVNVLVLHRDLPGNSVGITLAGGSDYEAKEITVHKVISGTPADRDGRLQKGDRILSINGKSMKGLTHKESLAILKAPRSEVVLVVSRWKPNAPEATTINSSDSSSLHSSSTITSSTVPVTSPTSPLSPTLMTLPTSPSSMTSPTSPPLMTSPVSPTSPLSPVSPRSPSLMTSPISSSSSPCSVRTVSSGSSSPQSRLMTSGTMADTVGATGSDSVPALNSGIAVRRGPPVDITLIKDGAGLGFSLEGGKDSPLGDQPLTIKKIFTGGCAEKNGQLRAGDEILAINQIPVSDMSRIEAWSMLKKLNDGSVHLCKSANLGSWFEK